MQKRVAIITDNEVPIEVTQHPVIHYWGNAFIGDNYKNKDHDLLDRLSDPDKPSVFVIAERELAQWVRDYLTGNNVQITRGRSAGEVLSMAGVHPTTGTVVASPEPLKIDEAIESGVGTPTTPNIYLGEKYDVLYKLARERGLATRRLKREELADLLYKDDNNANGVIV